MRYWEFKTVEMPDFLGKTLTAIEKSEDEIKFTGSNGEQWLMHHEQDCCEDVTIDDICGDLDDLIGSEILEAEEVSSEGEGAKSDYHESHTWTFYKMSTLNGGVTIRWYGASNGYYSESVSIHRLDQKAEW